MDREIILHILRQNQPELHRLGVKSLAVFGSVARGEASPESDVDILVEFNKSVGLFEFVGVKLRLEEILDTTADLATADAIRESMRAQILSDAVYA